MVQASGPSECWIGSTLILFRGGWLEELPEEEGEGEEDEDEEELIARVD